MNAIEIYRILVAGAATMLGAGLLATRADVRRVLVVLAIVLSVTALAIAVAGD